MENNIKQNIQNSIILTGPCGVGKSLIASTLSSKTNKPLLDIDDLIFFIEADFRGNLSQNKEEQKKFIEYQISDLRTLERDTPLTEEEKRREELLVYELVDLYTYYSNMFGGFNQFYGDFLNYHKAAKRCLTRHDEVYHLNKFTLEILNKVFETNDTSFIISPPAGFGWNTNNPLHFNTQLLQNKINTLLSSAQTVLLHPGEDYSLRTPSDDSSVNSKLFLKHPDYYYQNADLEISTNGLFNNPENDFLKQRTWLNVRETLTKERLKNRGEIDSICDQILTHLTELDMQR